MNEYYIKQYNISMRYQDFPGNECPILFIHGLGCAGSFDYPQVATQNKLKKHRCIIVDLLGAGYSDKPSDFEYSVSAHASYPKNFVDDLELKNLIIFGHSLGGAVAIELAARCGENVSQLILSESNLDPSTKGSTSYEIAENTEESFIQTGFHQMIDESSNNGNTMWAATLSNWLPTAAYRFSESAVIGGKISWRKILYELPIPKCFIFGEKSLPNDDYHVLQQNGIRIETVQNAGHSMAWENPQGLADAIADVIEL